MKIIFSRKGFDSSAGGVPSPILPDGRLVSLPIPDPLAATRYRDIASHDSMTGKLVCDLTRGRIKASARAHLDPDLLPDSLPRQPGWRPLFGQSGAAQGHLRNQGVSDGDLFLFFGLFQAVRQTAGRFHYDPGAPRKHLIFGWLQIGTIESIRHCRQEIRRWADYHPHFFHPDSANNTLYLAQPSLQLADRNENPIPGAGQFATATRHRTLTAPDATTPSQWLLPPWLYPAPGKPPLSYHNKPQRWQQSQTHTRLQAASRGQEFVLDCDHYPEAHHWLSTLFNPNPTSPQPAKPHPE